MDQSVAIQETLAEGEYCIIISFPALSSQPRHTPWPWEVEWTVSMCLSALLPLSVCHQGRRKPVFTKYLLSAGLCPVL